MRHGEQMAARLDSCAALLGRRSGRGSVQPSLVHARSDRCQEVAMRMSFVVVIAGMLVSPPPSSEAAAKTLAVLLAHADDETAVAPMLARYAREGVDVYVIIATDGGQGVGSI